MKVLVTGVCGQLGHDVMNELHSRGIEAVGSDIFDKYEGIDNDSFVANARYIQVDLTDIDAVEARFIFEQPNAIIHCGGWTRVDDAEDDENRLRVRAVNFIGTKNLVGVCNQLNIPLMFISTDYVFGGEGEKPWDADCTDFQPLNLYGQTKLFAEKNVASNLDKYFIVRTSWVYGKNGNNFVKTMLNLSKDHDEIKVVNDQIGRPTYAKDLARLLVDMILTDKYGYYHATNEGDFISWYDFACEIFRIANCNMRVIPVTTDEYGVSKAKRPKNSRLDTGKLSKDGFLHLPEWKDALARYMEVIS